MKNSDIYSVSLMCKVLNVSRASFYHHFYYSKDNSNEKSELLVKISEIHYDSKRTYGAPRITAVLRNEGRNISIKTVGKYMNILGIKSISSIKFPKRKNTMSDSEKNKIQNLIKDLDVNRPNQVWVTDITYIKTKEEGWVYLSSIIDLYSRKVIAWNIGRDMKKELVIQTLEMAFKKRNYPTNIIIHSDKGSQYRSHAFRELITKHHCIFSYTSLNHSCDENAHQESFHASLKKEWLYLQTYNTLADVKRAVFQYIEGFYNSKRLHSSLGYVSPDTFETNFLLQIPLLSMSNLLT